MARWRRLRAGIRITLIVSIAWTLFVVGYKTLLDVFGIFSVAELVEWIMQRFATIWGSGLILGLLFSAGIAFSRRNRQPRPLSVALVTTLGSLGGLVISMLEMTYYKRWSFSNYLNVGLPLTLFGSLIGYGIGRVAVPRDKPKAPLRETISRWSIGLSVAFLADGLFMARALHKGGYALLGYAQISLLPVFMPALLASLVILGFYAHGVWRRSWSVRRSGWVFFLTFALAVTVKVVVAVLNHKG